MGDPGTEEMEKTVLKYAKDGDGSLLIWTPPLDYVADSQSVESLVIPYQSRLGGALYAVPLPFLDEHFVTEANSGEEDGFLGPSKEFFSELIEEADESGAVLSTGTKVAFRLVVLDDSVLQQMREYDPVTDSTSFPCPFSTEKPNAIVSLKDISDAVKDWIDGLATGRQNFYSAREEPAPSKAAPKRQQKKPSTAVLADQVSALVAQMQLLTAQQEELRESFGQRGGATPVGEVANGLGEGRLPFVAPTAKATLPKQTLALVGPPPRTRSMAPVPGAKDVLPEDEPLDPFASGSQDQMGHQVAQALTQQSTAITALVAHLASGDPLADLASGGGSSSGLSAKGVARRERMQTELATGSSAYFLAVHQQIFRKMYPAAPVPKTEAEVVNSGATMCGYLEKHGNFKGQKDLALTMWILAHAFDSAARDDFRTCKEFIALMAASLDQAALDGNWSIAYLISLLEEPPSQMMSEKQNPLSSLGRPFAGMVPAQWSAVALAYLREMELLQSRKNESKAAKPPKREDPTPSPKRRPKFPKKPKPPDGGAEK